MNKKISSMRMIASDALARNLITINEFNELQEHCDSLECLLKIAEKMADEFYGRMVQDQATIKLKGE